jgi:hypothetical protein
MSRLPRLWRLFLLCAGLAMANGSAAGNANAAFTVQIHLVRESGGGASSAAAPSPESCVSSTVGHASNAEIQVLCTPGQFVNIQSASPGTGSAVGTGRALGAVEYGSLVPDRTLYGAGEMTSLRVLSLREDGRWLEMLVSF